MNLDDAVAERRVRFVKLMVGERIHILALKKTGRRPKDWLLCGYPWWTTNVAHVLPNAVFDPRTREEFNARPCGNCMRYWVQCVR